MVSKVLSHTSVDASYVDVSGNFVSTTNTVYFEGVTNPLTMPSVAVSAETINAWADWWHRRVEQIRLDALIAQAGHRSLRDGIVPLGAWIVGDLEP
jgi:hypothetical protein